MEFKTDILEDEILSTFGSEVLERLLRCHSRKYADIGNKKADDADYVYYHIVWATDDYSSNGQGLFYLCGGKRVVGYCRKSEIKKNIQDIDKFKVFIPEGYGAGETYPHQIIGVSELAPRNSVCSQTYLYAAFDQENDAMSFKKYLCTKFLRAVVLSVKIGQHAMNNVYRYVPLQDFTSNSDIDWSKSVAEIDQQLYAKYGLSEEEIAFVESMVKPME